MRLVNPTGNNPPAVKLKVVSEPETDVEVSATKNKRKASEMEFKIPPAKRPEPAEDSVTESESDLDVALPSGPPTSSLALATSKGNAAVHLTQGGAHLSSPQERFVVPCLQMILSQNPSRMTNFLQKWLAFIRNLKSISRIDGCNRNNLA